MSRLREKRQNDVLHDKGNMYAFPKHMLSILPVSELKHYQEKIFFQVLSLQSVLLHSSHNQK